MTAPAPVRCPRCPEPPPDGAAFCPRCGAACEAAADTAAVEERRVVTVVFCDLVGSTALSGRLDPETLRTVTLRYFALMRARIEEHGGTVEKFIGDAVMAVFGVPARHEDDARRALAAAHAMVTGLDVLNADLEREHGVRLAVRIGVNTGEVVAGIDPAARQALVSGEVVNIAARLEQHAGAGEVLIGPDTADAAGPSAVTEPAGSLALKGVAAALPARRLLGLHEDDPERMRRFDTPFVGRSQELAELRLLLGKLAADPASYLVTVYGEAGLGKTRLLREWLRDCPAYGAGRCRPYGETGTLAPLAEAVRHILDTVGEDAGLAGLPGAERAEADQALRLLRSGLLADGTPSPSTDDTVMALACLLDGLSRERPVVLVLDDCHWAAEPLLDMAARLLDELDRAPVALVCAARPELLETRPGWGSGRMRAASLMLTPLTREESAELAGGLVEVAAHRHGVLEGALDRAEGNPLYLEHLTALAAEGDDDLPVTVHALLGARIDALPPEERALLQLAAVLGREFRRTDLTELAAGPGDGAVPGVPGESAATLRGLVRRRLIETGGRGPVAGAELRFGSGLVQETAYRGMAKKVRARHHEDAARVLGRHAGADAAVGNHLARAHRLRAELGTHDGDTDALRARAAALLARAGTAALARSDLPWADDLLGQALDLAAPGEPAAAEAARGLGETKVARGEPARGRELLAGALADAERAGDRYGSAHARLALTALDPRHGSAAEVAATALPLFEAAGDDRGVARACVRLAQDRQRRGRHAEAEALLRRALEHADRADAEPERALALGAAGISLWRGPTPVADAVARCAELLAAHGAGRPTVRATLTCPLAVLLALRGRYAEARERLAEAERLADGLGYAEGALFIPLFAAEVEALAGTPERRLGLLAEAARAGRELGAEGALPGIARDRARTLLDGGDPAEALALPDPADADLPPAESADAHGLRARALALAGRADEARARAVRATAVAGDTDSPVVRGTAALDLARTLRTLGLPGEAAREARTALRHFTAKGHRLGADRATAFAADSAAAAGTPENGTARDGTAVDGPAGRAAGSSVAEGRETGPTDARKGGTP
ncbi:adenylate/guanylate cyclase domain-containing protein [Streptomyces sp. Z26]|uniref:adenylate/guanylate cyclase domain-containing protein n=1 Tax=Streptomyces sp. Z26 TaxID=2500177 RepID=UPI000EF13BB9|nr:adenylate/guanylate cyclase domain-containing protein [Streptomyces sp. Z26]RLL69328.1 adenylate/guanylate cyclase domain-containing protein [Streptomyces sp. Z26]